MGSNSAAGAVKPQGGLVRVSAVVVFVGAAALTFALYSGGAKPASARLAMRIKQQDDRILLSWDRDTPALRSSRGGVLHIDDGAQHRDVQLDSRLLANGSILYRPTTDDVSFQLEVRGRDGGLTAGDIRLLDGTVTSQAVAADGSDIAGTAPTAPLPTSTLVVINEPQTDSPSTETPLADAKQVATTGPVAPSELPVSPPAETSTGDTLGSVPLPVSAPAENSASEVITPKLILASSSAQPLTPTPISSVVGSAASDTTRPVDGTEMTSRKVAPPERALGVPVVVPTLPGSSPNENSVTAIVIPSKPLRRVMPDLRTVGMSSLVLDVEVVVKVNENGTVTEVHLVDEQRKLPPYIVFAALSAAKQWTFEAATVRGQKVASDHRIVFKFGSRGQ